MAAFKTVIWDLDGVLIWYHPDDPDKDWRRRIAGEEGLALWYDFQKSPAWQHCLRDQNADTRRLFRAFILNHYKDNQIKTDEVIACWLEDNLIPCAQAMQKIGELQQQGYQCAIASNQEGLRLPRVEKWLDRQGLGMLPRFFSCRLKTAKPDKAFFAHVAKALGRAPEEILFLDDTKANIRGARQAGWQALFIDDSYRRTPEKWHDLSLF